jgi:hypothetical protein
MRFPFEANRVGAWQFDLVARASAKVQTGVRPALADAARRFSTRLRA